MGQRISTAGSRRLTEQTLSAVERGQIAVEPIVRAALEDPSAFPGWLAEAVARASRSEPRRVRVRLGKRYSPEVLAGLLIAARRRFGRIPGVLGVAIGLKRKSGALARRQALVVWVEHKHEPAIARHRIPPELEAKVRGRAFRLPTDVQELATAKRQASKVRPGIGIAVRTDTQEGALGLICTSREGQMGAIVSGHVTSHEGQEIKVQIPTAGLKALGVVARRRVDTRQDAAWITGVPPDLIDRLATAPTDLRSLTLDDHDVWVEVRLRGESRVAHVEAVDAPANFGVADGWMYGLLKLDSRVTHDGDSGAPVLDWSRRVVGFVVGASDGHTYVLPAGRALDVATS